MNSLTVPPSLTGRDIHVAQALVSRELLTQEQLDDLADQKLAEPETALLRHAVAMELLDEETAREIHKEVKAAIIHGSGVGGYSEPHESEEAEQDPPKKGAGTMVVGLLLAVGGIVATSVSYSAAAPGETYTVYNGLVLVGAIMFVTGLVNMARGK